MKNWGWWGWEGFRLCLSDYVQYGSFHCFHGTLLLALGGDPSPMSSQAEVRCLADVSYPCLPTSPSSKPEPPGPSLKGVLCSRGQGLCACSSFSHKILDIMVFFFFFLRLAGKKEISVILVCGRVVGLGNGDWHC